VFISIATLLLAGGDHAHLHPTDADLFVCSPDVQTSLVAVKAVGLNGLLQDPAIVAAAGREVGLASGLEGLTGALGVDASSNESLMGALSSFSFSVAGLDELESAPTIEGSGVEDLFDVLMQHEVTVVFELKTEEARAEARAAADQVAVDMAGAESVHETPAGAVTVTEYELMPGSTGRGAWLAEWGTHIAFGIGEQGAPGLLSRLNGGESLASTERWTTGQAAMREEGGVEYMRYHHNLIGDPWYALSAKDSGLPVPGVILSALELFFSGILPMGASEEHGVCRIVGKEYLFEVMDFSSPATEAAKRLPEDFLSLVNPEAVGVWATTFDAEGLTEAGLKLVADQIGVPSSVIRSEFTYSVGVEISDLMAPFSDNAAFYMLPINGATIPRFHAVVKLEDAAAYEATWIKVASFLKTQGAQYVEVEDRPYRKVPIYSLKRVSEESAPRSGGGSPLDMVAGMGLTNPAFTVAILPDRALFGLSSSYVKREVRRLLKEEENPPLHPLAQGARPCPEGVDYFGSLNWPDLIGGIYDTAMAFLPLLGDSGALPFDVDALPETEVITRHFNAARVWSKPGAQGTYSVKRSSIGFEIALQGALLAAPFAAPGVFSGDSAQREIEAEIALTPEEFFEDPPEEEIEEEDLDAEAQQKTAAILKEVKLALVIFKADSSAFPDTLEELVVPTANYPKAFLDVLPFDGWGRAFFYAFDKEEGSYRLWSAGADGVNNGGSGDDIVSS
jgi:general secretion pathway protein G